MDVSKYLKRISYCGKIDCTLETLRHLVEAHLQNVPFGNMDLFGGPKRTFVLRDIYHRIVVQKRGGICCELNGLFSWLLAQLGFAVDLLSGELVIFGNLPPDTHPIIGVRFAEEYWYVEVGSGGSLFLEPIKAEVNLIQCQTNGIFKICKTGSDNFVLTRKRKSQCVDGKTLKQSEESDWKILLQFSGVVKEICDLRPDFEYHQTSKETWNSRNCTCSRVVGEKKWRCCGVTFSYIKNLLTRQQKKLIKPT